MLPLLLVANLRIKLTRSILRNSRVFPDLILLHNSLLHFGDDFLLLLDEHRHHQLFLVLASLHLLGRWMNFRRLKFLNDYWILEKSRTALLGHLGLNRLSQSVLIRLILRLGY